MCHSAIVCISPCIRLFKRCRFCLYILNDITKYESGSHLLQIVTLKTQSLHRDTAKRIYVKYLLRIMANVLPTQFYGKICPLCSLCSKLKKNIYRLVSRLNCLMIRLKETHLQCCSFKAQVYLIFCTCNNITTALNITF